MDRTGGTYSHHQHGGNCHICGAAALYTALFYHKPTNSYIRTGLECANKLDSAVDGEKFRSQVIDAREQVAGKRKAQAVLSDAGHAKAWEIYTTTPAGEPYFAGSLGNSGFGEPSKTPYEERTIIDIVSKLVKYGSISPAQMTFIGRLLDKIANRAAIEAQRTVEHDASAPLPVTDKRMLIRGKVLSIKEPQNDWDIQITRILVQHADGWKVFGTRPTSLADVKRGDVVEFRATVKPSKDDPKFGFFSRPTNGQIVEPVA